MVCWLVSPSARANQMANNVKTKARKAKRVKKQVRWLTKFQTDIDKILSTGELPSHYFGGGQPFTRGKEKSDV